MNARPASLLPRMALLALGLAVPAAAPAQNLSGAATAIDGDTLSLGGSLISLQGMDALEAGQVCRKDDMDWECGAEATAKLAELIQGRRVECTLIGRNTAGKLVGQCMMDGRDIAEEMVLTGYAVAVENMRVDYSEMQARAERYGFGMWAGSFERPDAWRAAHPAESARLARSEVPAKPKPRKQKVYRNKFGCAIKGNHSRRMNDWIYYLPGQNYYDETRAEAFFCTEAEAQKAGYRPSRAG